MADAGVILASYSCLYQPVTRLTQWRLRGFIMEISALSLDGIEDGGKVIMIFPPNSDYTIVLQKDSYYLAITMLLPCNNYAFAIA